MPTQHSPAEEARRRIEQAAVSDQKWLSLADLELDAPPPALRKATRLQALDLSGNHVVEVPDWFSELTDLRVLNLSRNRLAQVPACIKAMRHLENLTLRDNHLVALPQWLATMRSLTQLDLSGNWLEEIPPWVGGLELLRIEVGGNPHLGFPPPETVAQGSEAVLAFLRTTDARSTALSPTVISTAVIPAAASAAAAPPLPAPYEPGAVQRLPTAGRTAPPKRRRTRTILVGAAVAVVLALAAGTYLTLLDHHAPTASTTTSAAAAAAAAQGDPANSADPAKGPTPTPTQPTAPGKTASGPSTTILASTAAQGSAQPGSNINPPTAPSAGETTQSTVSGVIHGWGDYCLDDAGAAAVNDNTIQLAACNGSTAQTWSVVAADNSMQVLGMCMTVENGGTQTGTDVVLYDCDQSAAQTWLRQSDDTLYNPQSGKCLSDPLATPSYGAALDISGCTGDPNQQWTAPS